MRVAVVSAVFGGYDEPVFTPQTIPCSYTLVSDDSVLVPRDADHQWFQVGGLHPRLVGKFVKCRPWEYADADVFVWMDGSFELKPEAIEQMVVELGDGLVGFFPHEARTSIVSEASYSSRLPKYEGLPVVEQAEFYVGLGLPGPSGLWAGGLFIWRDCSEVRQLGQLWLDEICRWTIQDQISLPFVLWRCGIVPRVLSGGVLSNRRFRIRDHAHRL